MSVNFEYSFANLEIIAKTVSQIFMGNMQESKLQQRQMRGAICRDQKSMDKYRMR